MWLSEALLLTIVLSLDSSWPTKYWRIQQFAYNTKPWTGCRKTVATT